ncbi:ribosomal protein RPL18, partial [Toxoplasma gondii TgCatPRC2]
VLRAPRPARMCARLVASSRRRVDAESPEATRT